MINPLSIYGFPYVITHWEMTRLHSQQMHLNMVWRLPFADSDGSDFCGFSFEQTLIDDFREDSKQILNSLYFPSSIISTCTKRLLSSLEALVVRHHFVLYCIFIYYTVNKLQQLQKNKR